MPALAHKTSTSRSHRRLRALFAIACAAFCVAVLPAAASAQSYIVDTNSNDDTLQCATPTVTSDADCSLPGAIKKSNTNVGLDVITFSTNFTIPINVPLPIVTDALTIDAGTKNIAVVGGSYTCTPNLFALDILAATEAKPIIVRGVAFNGVCGRAIRSNVPAPTVTVGPRKADNTVPISGTTDPSAYSVDLFDAKNVAFDGEADTGGFIQAVPAAGVFSYTPPVVPPATGVYTATATAVAGTSGFSTRAHTPADLTSPVLNNVVATSNSRVRLDFSEALSGGSANPAAFALGMANIARPIVGASVDGNSLYVDSSLPWGTGEAGAISMTGNGRVMDAVGNELLGTPTAPVYAGPGELDVPVISNFKLSPNRFCQRKSRKCKRGSTYIYITLNKPARVIFKVARGTARRSELVTFIHRLKPGKNKVKFDAIVSGRTLPATILTIRAVAQDVARTNSAPVDTPLKIVKSNADL